MSTKIKWGEKKITLEEYNLWCAVEEALEKLMIKLNSIEGGEKND